MLEIPIGAVLGKHTGFLGLELRQRVRAAVQQGIVPGSQAKLFALLGKERAINRHESLIVYHRQEIGHRILQGVLQGIIIQRLYTHGIPFGLGGGLLPLLGGSGAIVVFLRAHDDLIQRFGAAGGMLGVEDVFGSCHKIVSRHFSHGIALRVHPLHALAQAERPGQAVGAGFPAFSQAGLKLPIPV